MNGPDRMEPAEIIDPWEDYEEEDEQMDFYSERADLMEALLVANNLKAKLRMIDELMDEILILDNPEAMREVAAFVQEVIKQ